MRSLEGIALFSLALLGGAAWSLYGKARDAILTSCTCRKGAWNPGCPKHGKS